MTQTLPVGATSGTPGYGSNGPTGQGSATYGTGTQSVPLTQVGGEVDPAAVADKTGGANASSAVTLFGWLLGWAVFIFFLWLLTRSRAGYALVYYGAWAALIILLLTQYRWFIAVLAPVSGLVLQPPSGGASSGGASSGGGGAGGSF